MLYPVVFQCTLGSKLQAHWIPTALPLAQAKGCLRHIIARHQANTYQYADSPPPRHTQNNTQQSISVKASVHERSQLNEPIIWKKWIAITSILRLIINRKKLDQKPQQPLLHVITNQNILCSLNKNIKFSIFWKLCNCWWFNLLALAIHRTASVSLNSKQPIFVSIATSLISTSKTFIYASWQSTRWPWRPVVPLFSRWYLLLCIQYIKIILDIAALDII